MPAGTRTPLSRDRIVDAACMVPPPACTRIVIHAHNALSTKNGAFSHARAMIHEIPTPSFERDARSGLDGAEVRWSGQ